MDELLAEVDWETTTLGEGFGHLQEILVVANTLLHPNQDQKTDWLQKHLSVERVRKALNNEE